jgi:hypothetical protein
MRPSGRRTIALVTGALLTLSLAQGAFASSAAGADGMVTLRVRGAGPGHGAGTNANLYSHGGSIEAAPKVYISWWGSQWSTGFSTGNYTSAQAQTYVRDFFGSVGGSSWINSTSQYCQGVSSGTYTCPSNATFVGNPTGQLSGDYVDSTPVPSKPRQSDIANAAARLATHFGGVQPGATYFVFTPSGHSMTGFGTRWCAWHSSSSSMAYAYMPYIPDAGRSCGMNFVNATNNSFGNGYFDGFSVVGGHEYAEAQTDPFPSSGWLDSSGSENGDKCAWSSSSTNITLGGNPFAVQPLWSNANSGCVTSY